MMILMVYQMPAFAALPLVAAAGVSDIGQREAFPRSADIERRFEK